MTLKITYMKNINFFNFDYTNSLMRNELINSYTNFLDSNYYVLGENVKKFEAEYAQFSGVKFCSGVSNGLDAIILSLKAIGIQSGDEVIVPSNTYIATWLAVTSLGGVVVPVEPNENTYNINTSLIEGKITNKTKAIIPVHLYGLACDMVSIMSIASKYNLYVIEDNAQAHSATVNGKMTGSFGHVNATSFYPGKNLGALGEAGGITTNSIEAKLKIDSLRNYGSKIKYKNELKGGNFRIDELQATQLRIRLKYLDHLTDYRIGIANQYDKLITNKNFIKPYSPKGYKHVYHQYIIITENREDLVSYLNSKGIRTLIHYPIPPHLQECYKDLGYKEGDFPIAENLSKNMVSLPIYPGLIEEEVQYISECLNLF